MDYELIRSGRRTLALEITREGRVLLRAPYQASQRQIDAFYAAHQSWLETHLAQVRARLAAHPEPDEAEIRRLRADAQALLPKRVAWYARKMGVSPAAVTITGAKTRFGSCSAQGRISFSWRLMNYPPEAIDYVVVHELAHLVHHNHSPSFYALVESVLPDYRARAALLKV